MTRNQAYYAANREREKARSKAYRDANPQAHKAATLAWREANKERHAAMQHKWHDENREQRKAYRRSQYLLKKERENACARAWKAANPHRAVALTAKRMAALKQAVPLWASLRKIEAFYAEARTLTIATGIAHHVDHIVPLQSKLVCGLHCEANLQVLTAFENQSKLNRTWPGMDGLLEAA